MRQDRVAEQLAVCAFTRPPSPRIRECMWLARLGLREAQVYPCTYPTSNERFYVCVATKAKFTCMRSLTGAQSSYMYVDTSQAFLA